MELESKLQEEINEKEKNYEDRTQKSIMKKNTQNEFFDVILNKNINKKNI